MAKRRGPTQTSTLQERIANFAAENEREIQRLPPGPERDALIKKLRQAKIAENLDGWLTSPGLKPPR
jgi:hypothetical protein